MPVYYLEPSAFVKYYVSEPGSAWVQGLVTAEDSVLATVEITIAEISAAMATVARLGRISRRQCDEFWGRFKSDLLSRCELFPTHRSIINHAAELCQKHPLRGFDAVHLASGLELRDTLAQEGIPLSMVYVTGDARLISAAESEGLAVDNPFWHTDLDS
jgi:predicted nucleic acid-binding protein